MSIKISLAIACVVSLLWIEFADRYLGNRTKIILIIISSVLALISYIKNMHLESKYDHISGYFCIECGRMNVPVLTGGWVEPLCEDCYNKRIARQKRWHEKNHPDREFKYTPYKDLKKEEQKLDMIAVYKHFSADRGDYEEKRDYSDTINKIIARQGKLLG